MASRHDVLGAVLRSDFYAFTVKAFETVNPGRTLDLNWHIELMCYLLAQARNGEILRLILCLCPRSLKSFITSVAFPAWCIGNDPTMRFICVSYSDDLAVKHSRDFARIIEAPWYRIAFPKARFDGKKFTEREMETTLNGGRYATSVSGVLTGRGGDAIVIDDPIKADAATSDAERNRVNRWFTSTVTSRFDDPSKGILIIVSQRTHMDDLVGHVLPSGVWEHVSIPAIATEDEEIQVGIDKVVHRKKGESMHPSRLPIEFLQRVRAETGTYNFEAQYQQNPIPRQGNLVRAEWLRTYDEEPHQVPYDYVVQSWDTASSVDPNASYSACTTWGLRQNRYFLLDVYRERLLFPGLLDKARRHARAWGARRVLIEDAASGRQLLQSLNHETDIPLTPMPANADKITRLECVSPSIERGRVHLPRNTPWVGAFIEEILAFPNTRHDDQVDSMSQFLRWAMDREQFRPPEVHMHVFGGSRGRDRYRERTGLPTLPRSVW